MLTEDRASVGSDGRSKRWVVVRPPEGGTGLLLTLPHGAKQLSQVGRQADGRVAWFLQVEEFAPVHARMVEAGVEFLEAPRHEEYGTVAVFRDCSGNRWDLLGASGRTAGATNGRPTSRSVDCGSHGEAHGRRRRRRPAAGDRATCATTRWRPSPSSRCGCSGRCCSRASPAPARPRWPRRSPQALDLPLVRLQCYEGIDATQALYDWDFPRQILHLRALEAAGGGTDVEEAEKSLYDERFLLARPVLAALQQSPAVLLVDEVDRADDEFEAFLLEVLSTYQVSIPELGTVAAATPPIVVLTSNRTRELHDALKRRCLYHWIDHPGLEREVQIVAVARARGLRGAGPPGRRRRPAAARHRPAEAARRRRDPRLGPGAAAPRHHRRSTSSRRRGRSARW